MKYLRTVLTLLVGLLLAVSSASKAENKKVYTIAVVPQMRMSDIYEKWMPFVKKLSEELGIEIQIKPYTSIPQFETDLLKGVPDFAYMNPYHEVMAKKAQGYIPLIKDKTPLVGILVAHKTGGVNTIKDLKGKEVAFPAPNAFAASLYMRALLKEKEKVSITPLYVKTHDNVYRTVILEKAAAGGGVNSTLMKQPTEIKNQLKTIYETPGSASHPLSAHPRVPEEMRKRLAKAVLKLASDPANRIMFDNIQMPEPVAADYEKDYLPLKKLGLDKYAVLEAE